GDASRQDYSEPTTVRKEVAISFCEDLVTIDSARACQRVRSGCPQESGNVVVGSESKLVLVVEQGVRLAQCGDELLSLCALCNRHIRIAGGKELLLLQLHVVPRRIANDSFKSSAQTSLDVLAAGCCGRVENLRELQLPVKEAMLGKPLARYLWDAVEPSIGFVVHLVRNAWLAPRRFRH